MPGAVLQGRRQPEETVDQTFSTFHRSVQAGYRVDEDMAIGVGVTGDKVIEHIARCCVD